MSVASNAKTWNDESRTRSNLTTTPLRSQPFVSTGTMTGKKLRALETH